jgi:hypothetical protein
LELSRANGCGREDGCREDAPLREEDALEFKRRRLKPIFDSCFIGTNEGVVTFQERRIKQGKLQVVVPTLGMLNTNKPRVTQVDSTVTKDLIL